MLGFPLSMLSCHSWIDPLSLYIFPRVPVVTGGEDPYSRYSFYSGRCLRAETRLYLSSQFYWLMWYTGQRGVELCPPITIKWQPFKFWRDGWLVVSINKSIWQNITEIVSFDIHWEMCSHQFDIGQETNKHWRKIIFSMSKYTLMIEKHHCHPTIAFEEHISVKWTLHNGPEVGTRGHSGFRFKCLLSAPWIR